MHNASSDQSIVSTDSSADAASELTTLRHAVCGLALVFDDHVWPLVSRVLEQQDLRISVSHETPSSDGHSHVNFLLPWGSSGFPYHIGDFKAMWDAFADYAVEKAITMGCTTVKTVGSTVRGSRYEKMVHVSVVPEAFHSVETLSTMVPGREPVIRGGLSAIFDGSRFGSNGLGIGWRHYGHRFTESQVEFISNRLRSVKGNFAERVLAKCVADGVFNVAGR